ncbi:hypothetical protein KJ925_05205 [Patescibacteria group bacterium]|nr:hypothetical protein [Patescibacteria group bacterium]
MDIKSNLKTCPLVILANKLGWSEIDISGADDLARNFFPKYPNSKQRNLMKELRKLIKKMSKEKLEKIVIDSLVWSANLCIELNHKSVTLQDVIDKYGYNEVNVELLYFISELMMGEHKDIRKRK